ncbi:hypothetical protein REPUB_Repub01dG0150300 [Reevesia pubescens]
MGWFLRLQELLETSLRQTKQFPADLILLVQRIISIRHGGFIRRPRHRLLCSHIAGSSFQESIGYSYNDTFDIDPIMHEPRIRSKSPGSMP